MLLSDWRHLSTFKDTMKTLTISFLQVNKWPLLTLYTSYGRMKAIAQAPWWCGLDEGGNGSIKQAEQQGRCSLTGEGNSSSNADPQKSWGNKLISLKSPSYKRRQLSHTLNSQMATLGFFLYFFSFYRGEAEGKETWGTIVPKLKSQSCPEWSRTERRKETSWSPLYQLLTVCYIVPLCYQAPTNCPWSCMIRGEQ